MNHNQQDRFGHSGDDSWRAGRRNQSNINDYNASYRNNFQEGQQPTKRGRYGEPVHGQEQMPSFRIQHSEIVPIRMQKLTTA